MILTGNGVAGRSTAFPIRSIGCLLDLPRVGQFRPPDQSARRLITSLVSALTKIPVRCDVAMTGEITLRGKVLPIGGVKEKVLAAHRNGIRLVLLPRENEKDMEEVPGFVQENLTIKFVETMDEVLQLALERPLDAVPLRVDEKAEPVGPDYKIEGEAGQDRVTN